MLPYKLAHRFQREDFFELRVVVSRHPEQIRDDEQRERFCIVAEELRATPLNVAGWALTFAAVAVAPPGHAVDDVALNGTFTAFSDGQWAKTNEIMEYQNDVVATWTITSSCTTFQDCTGTVVSDQGWTPELVYQSQKWRATHTVEDWQRCPDGSTAPGEQTYTFWAKRLDAPDRHDRLTGFDQTISPCGACGVNRWLNVRMPFTLTRVS